MKVLVKTAKMEKEEWLKWRTKGIGGSDASVIAGINPWRSIYELWQEKTGACIPQEAGNEFTHFGSILESVVKEEFTRRTGLKVRAKNAILQSDDYPFMLADLDGTINEDGEHVIFEAKTASAYKKDEWEYGVPEEYVFQLQHYMAVTGMRKAYIAALIGGNSFIFHEVRRDQKMIDDIIRMESDFWNGNVLAGKEPVMDGTDATKEYLSKLYSTPNGGTVELPEEALSLCEQYDALKEQLEKMEKKKAAAENQLKQLLKENEVGTVGNRKVSWTPVTKTSIDSKRMKMEDAKLYDRFSKVTTYRRFLVA